MTNIPFFIRIIIHNTQNVFIEFCINNFDFCNESNYQMYINKHLFCIGKTFMTNAIEEFDKHWEKIFLLRCVSETKNTSFGK